MIKYTQKLKKVNEIFCFLIFFIYLCNVIKITMNRTAQALEKLFEASRRRQEKKKEAAKEAYRKASESIKKILDSKLSTNSEETPQNVRKWHLEVYRTRYVERCPSDDELYQTREELKKKKKEHWQCINWSKFK